MSYGKIDTATNYLMSSEVMVDGTWRPITDFAVDGNGDYYSYYISSSQPDTDKNIAEVNHATKYSIDKNVNKITVEYNGNTFSGSYEAQALIATTIEKIKGNSPHKTQTMFTIHDEKVNLTKSDLEAIMVLIEPLQEAIVNA